MSFKFGILILVSTVSIRSTRAAEPDSFWRDITLAAKGDSKVAGTLRSMDVFKEVRNRYKSVSGSQWLTILWALSQRDKKGNPIVLFEDQKLRFTDPARLLKIELGESLESDLRAWADGKPNVKDPAKAEAFGRVAEILGKLRQAKDGAMLPIELERAVPSEAPPKLNLGKEGKDLSDSLFKGATTRPSRPALPGHK